MTQYIFTDIHGCKKSFLALLDQVGPTTADEIFILGDYVDRGPDSKGVIDTIWKMQSDGYTITCLMGNHEAITLDDYDVAKRFKGDERGDQSLLKSFDVTDISAVPKPYIDWMRALPLVHEIPGAILVHAGLDFSQPDPIQPYTEQIWIRDWYPDINYAWLGDRIIIHGHTPVPQQTTENMMTVLDDMRVLDIDTGCVFNKRMPGYLGNLCCLDYTNMRLHFQKNVEE